MTISLAALIAASSPFVAYCTSGPARGHYAAFASVGSVDREGALWDVVFSPPVIEDGELIDWMTFTAEGDSSAASRDWLDGLGLVRVPSPVDAVVRRHLFDGLGDSVRAPSAGDGWRGRYAPGDALIEEVRQLLRARPTEPWLLGALAPSDHLAGDGWQDAAAAGVLDRVEAPLRDLQLLLEGIGVRIALAPATGPADHRDAGVPWREFE